MTEEDIRAVDRLLKDDRRLRIAVFEVGISYSSNSGNHY